MILFGRAVARLHWYCRDIADVNFPSPYQRFMTEGGHYLDIGASATAANDGKCRLTDG